MTVDCCCQQTWNFTGIPGPPNYHIVRYDVSGASPVAVWRHSFAEDADSPDANGFGVVVDSSGNPIVCGSTKNTPEGYVSVAKYDGATGGLLWRSLHSSDGDTQPARGIVIDGSDNVYVSDRTTGPSPFVVKLNSSGVKQWQTSLVHPIADKALAIDSSGNVWAGGSTGGSKNLTKLDSDGNILSTWLIGSGGSPQILALAIDSGDNVYTSGDNVIRKHNSSMTEQWSQNVSSTGTPFVLKTDASYLYFGGRHLAADNVGRRNLSDGTVDWSAAFNTNDWTVRESSVDALAVDSSGALYVGGDPKDPDPGTDEESFGLFNTSGVEQWAAIYSEAGEIVQDMALSGDDVLFVCGGYQSY